MQYRTGREHVVAGSARLLQQDLVFTARTVQPPSTVNGVASATQPYHKSPSADIPGLNSAPGNTVVENDLNHAYIKTSHSL